MSTFMKKGMGWIPDLPDIRDYTFQHPEILSTLVRLKRPPGKELPEAVDLRSDSDGVYLTDTEDQGSLNSSPAFAVLSLIEYFERRIHGHTFEGSKLFLYKVSRNQLAMGRTLGDVGAGLRTTLKRLVRFGVPPEAYWPYEIDKFDQEQSAFVYGLATPFHSLRYIRLDARNDSGVSVWSVVKSFLAAGFPAVFGFSVPASVTLDANIPFRPDYDSILGGQAVVAVGYQSDFFGHGKDGLLIRSSWGRQWGDQGNGWLPVAFIHNQLARDFWTVVNIDWLDIQECTRPTVVDS